MVEPALASAGGSGAVRTLRAPVVIDAHGSWERGPATGTPAATLNARGPRRDADLFAFKANFRNARLSAGFLPVLALSGGYGGMVQGDDGRTTLACCVRRDALAAARERGDSGGAGVAVEALLRRSCAGVRAALEGAVREGCWLTVGPLSPGIRVDAFHGAFRVGNAAGESHPLIGEGISMALEGAALLASMLLRQPAAALGGTRALEVHRRYAAAWRRAFAPRLKVAAVYAHIAMRPPLAAAAREVLRRWPSLLHRGARLAGKATRPTSPSSTAEIA